MQSLKGVNIPFMTYYITPFTIHNYTTCLHDYSIIFSQTLVTICINSFSFTSFNIIKTSNNILYYNVVWFCNVHLTNTIGNHNNKICIWFLYLTVKKANKNKSAEIEMKTVQTEQQSKTGNKDTETNDDEER